MYYAAYHLLKVLLSERHGQVSVGRTGNSTLELLAACPGFHFLFILRYLN